MRPILRWAAFAAMLLLATARPAMAQVDQQRLVNSAAATVERLRGDPDSNQHVAPLLENAKAVLIVPNLLKAGFILGGEYGTGVLLARRAEGGWSYPAFYTLAAGSLGIQAGVQDSEVLFAIMTDKALSALMASSVKFGADLSLAVLVVGAGMEASTTANLGADVYAFSRTMGLFGGGSLEGAMVKPRGTWNSVYYGVGTTPEAIVVEGSARNAAADPLRDALAR
jgi:lipid-binding SYLF domain-containing protein